MLKEYIYILKNEKLRVKIIRLHHDVPVAGHRKGRRQQSCWQENIGG